MRKGLLFTLLLISASVTIKANNYTVTTVSDTGAGSLRVMMDSANAHAGLDTITLSLSVHDTIHLASPLSVITDSLVITGLPCQNPTISGDSLAVNGPAILCFNDLIFLSLNYLNIFECVSTQGNNPGAVFGGQLYINNCYFYGNSVTGTGGSGLGGAIDAISATIYNSTFNNNSCGNTGIGGAVFCGACYLYNCTFVNNYASQGSGALNCGYGEIQNCTFSNNSGGALGRYQPGGGLIIANSIFWGNTSLTDSTTINTVTLDTSGGCNILQDIASNDSFKTVNSDISGVNPQFGTFGYYSGCVPVLPILCGSIAENHATCPGATTSDAEGIITQGIRDAGAFEITRPHLGGDTIDSIAHGAKADLFNYFNLTGLTIQWPASLNDSTAASVATGTYIVIGINFLGCSDTATVIIRYNSDTLMGLKNLQKGIGIGLYPNPTHDLVTIEWGGKISGAMVLKVTDMLGRIVLSQNTDGASGKFTMNIGSLGSGTYYIGLEGGRDFGGSKLIVLPR